ncbi:MAG: GNAT family N-acetyltransferase [Sulfitobacter sp.]
MTPTAAQLFDVCDHTWPAAQVSQIAGWTIREGQGGGKRVSAATTTSFDTTGDIPAAENAMRAMGQTPLFMVREGEEALDLALEASGYDVVDPVNMYAIPVSRLTDIPIPRVTAFCIWEPLAIMAEIWNKGGIGPARLDVMARAQVKTGVLARWNEKPAGTAFAAMHDNICMVHAVEVLVHQRKQGVAQWIMRAAGFWAAKNGADSVAVLCTRENVAANRLYTGLGFEIAGHYHYRQIQD